MQQAWVNIANAYSSEDWSPLNPVIHPTISDADGDPTPVYNCSISRFNRLKDIDPDSDTHIRRGTAAFCQSLYRDIKSELSLAAEKNSRSGCTQFEFGILLGCV